MQKNTARKITFKLYIISLIISLITICLYAFILFPRQEKLDERRQILMQNQQEIDKKLTELERKRSERKWAPIKWRIEKKMKREIRYAFRWLTSYRDCGSYDSGTQLCTFGKNICTECKGAVAFKSGEICDGQDNNENGWVDEGCDCIIGNSQSCTANGIDGIQECFASDNYGPMWRDCVPLFPTKRSL